MTRAFWPITSIPRKCSQVTCMMRPRPLVGFVLDDQGCFASSDCIDPYPRCWAVPSANQSIITYLCGYPPLFVRVCSAPLPFPWSGCLFHSRRLQIIIGLKKTVSPILPCIGVLAIGNFSSESLNSPVTRPISYALRQTRTTSTKPRVIWKWKRRAIDRRINKG